MFLLKNENNHLCLAYIFSLFMFCSLFLCLNSYLSFSMKQLQCSLSLTEALAEATLLEHCYLKVRSSFVFKILFTCAIWLLLIVSY